MWSEKYAIGMGLHKVPHIRTPSWTGSYYLEKFSSITTFLAGNDFARGTILPSELSLSEQLNARCSRTYSPPVLTKLGPRKCAAGEWVEELSSHRVPPYCRNVTLQLFTRHATSDVSLWSIVKV